MKTIMDSNSLKTMFVKFLLNLLNIIPFLFSNVCVSFFYLFIFSVAIIFRSIVDQNLNIGYESQ